jgi:hypothetical protein
MTGVQASLISKFSKHENESTGGRVRGNAPIHSVEKFPCLATRQDCYGGHRLQGYPRCSLKLGSISFSEGIMGLYLYTIPSCSEYFDSIDATSADNGQTFPKTESAAKRVYHIQEGPWSPSFLLGVHRWF